MTRHGAHTPFLLVWSKGHTPLGGVCIRRVMVGLTSGRLVDHKWFRSKGAAGGRWGGHPSIALELVTSKVLSVSYSFVISGRVGGVGGRRLTQGGLYPNLIPLRVFAAPRV